MGAGPINPITAAAVDIHTTAIGLASVVHVYALLLERDYGPVSR
jgi:hypothetical protein